MPDGTGSESADVPAGRRSAVQVTELPDGTPVLIGQIPLEIMDWVIDMKGRKPIGNPAHGGNWEYEMYAAAEGLRWFGRE